MWTPEYFVRYVAFPLSVDGVTIPNDDGTFDIYINSGLSPERQGECLRHEVRHIIQNHFYNDKIPVSSCELEASGQRRSARAYLCLRELA